MNPLLLFVLFLKASTLSFGGLGGLPMLHQDLVAQGVPDVDNLVGHALAIQRLSPGPNGLYIVPLGYLLGRVPGAAAATAALALPPLVVLLIMVVYGKLARFKRTENSLLLLSFAITGLLGFTSWQIVQGSSSSLLEWVVALAGFVLATRSRLNPFVLVAATGVLGVAVYR